MKRVLVLRPEPGAAATAARAAAIGLTPIVAPLFEIVQQPWDLPDTAFDAVMLTSANAARLLGSSIEPLRSLPAYAVGAATAEAARAAGFPDVRVGPSDAEALIALMARDGVSNALHLAAREHKAVGHPAVRLTRRIVYAAVPVEVLPEPARDALSKGAVALLHSPRAAARFAELMREPAEIAIAAISPAALAAAGSGWRARAIADAPDDTRLLAAAATLFG